MKKKKKRRRGGDEGAYVCPTCGEQIEIPLDLSGGPEQQYVEDCPVCCNPNVIHVEFSARGSRPACGRTRSEQAGLRCIGCGQDDNAGIGSADRPAFSFGVLSRGDLCFLRIGTSSARS